MTMHVIPVSPSSPRADVLSHPFRALSVVFSAWQQSQRRRADRALLMSMEPHMLQDIGVALAEQSGSSGMLQWHPAMLATTLKGSSKDAKPNLYTFDIVSACSPTEHSPRRPASDLTVFTNPCKPRHPELGPRCRRTGQAMAGVPPTAQLPPGRRRPPSQIFQWLLRDGRDCGNYLSCRS